MRFVEVDKDVFVNLDAVEFVELREIGGRLYFAFVFPNTGFNGKDYTEPVAYSRGFESEEEALEWFREIAGIKEAPTCGAKLEPPF